ncbi:hypothetical protein [Aliarcobacter thereius]|uniref:hypothetical protein n=1 Tax=Aliarcobacter thereius TaxID=544718 RepID=UPI00082982F6|nr:hypothetical protein [Aliarcobacter thereius]
MNTETIKENLSNLKNLSGVSILVSSFYMAFFDSITKILKIHYDSNLLVYLFTLSLVVLVFIVWMILVLKKEPAPVNSSSQKKTKKKKKK